MKYIWIILSIGLLLITGCYRHQPLKSISIKGSDTEVNLVLQLAEAYMGTNPYVSLCVTGGGSGVGIAGLLNGNTDVANSSRDLNTYEATLAQDRGITIQSFIFAYDALAIICHQDMAIDSLTVEELSQIFSGKTKKWLDSDGQPFPISLYGRQSNSGTYIYFREKVIGTDYSTQMRQMNGNAQILEAVKSDRYAIAYIGLGYISDKHENQRKGIKVVSIKPNRYSPAISPLSNQALLEGLYPLVRPLYQFTNGSPNNVTQAFFDFEKSEAGLAIIAKNGYLPVPKVPTTAQSI